MSKADHVNRREFLRTISLTGAGLYMVGCTQKQTSPLPTPVMESTIKETEAVDQTAEDSGPSIEEPVYGDVYLSVLRGEDPGEMARRAVAAIGGMGKFVPAGADVIIKPNICTDYYSYEYGATTNPEVVAALVSLCLGAGAGRVRVMDNPFAGTALSAYQKSGIGNAVGAAGGEMEVMNSNKFRKNDIPDGLDIKEWNFYQDILNADVVINAPIAKHHGITGLTLGCKNLMGTILNRGQIHSNIDQRIADIVSRVRPTLTVIDGMRTLLRGGPTGGNLDDVKMSNTVIASTDVVAADSYAATLFDKTGSDIGYIRAAANMGLGTMDLDSIKIEELTL
jgi:uncharacterized protein (DUF362 family)